MTGSLEPHITAAGLPGRTEQILRRDHNEFPVTVDALTARRKAAPTGAPLSADALRGAFEQAAAQSAAAWLAGRVSSQEFLPQLHALTEAPDPGAPEAATVEAAMSLALHGEKVAALEVLLPRGAPGPRLSPLACYYLGQLGELAGWDGLLAAARATDGHTRLLAANYALVYLPWAGKATGTGPVDPRSLLVERLTDADVLTARQIPALIAEFDLASGDVTQDH